MVKIYLGSDHAGFSLKQEIKKYLAKKKISFEDLGDFSEDNNTENKFSVSSKSKNFKDDDYPDFIIPVARKVAKEKNSLGIVVGGSGQGEAIAANKIKGIRCGLYYGNNIKIVKLMREHNNCNTLSLGARFLSEKEALKAVDIFLKSKFLGGKHRRRIKKLDNLGGK